MAKRKMLYDFVVLYKYGEPDQEPVHDYEYIRYFFRSIERFTPWVRNIFFVTSNLVPVWLNVDNPKIHVVRPADFVPVRFLPTSNMNVASLYLDMIPDITDCFVVFDGNEIITRRLKENAFFKKGVPYDAALMDIPVAESPEDIHAHVMMNNAALLNSYFDKATVLKIYKSKFFSGAYGDDVRLNRFTESIADFTGFAEFPIPYSFTKMMFTTVRSEAAWYIEEASSNEFESKNDIDYNLVRAWNICEGRFLPMKTKTMSCFDLGTDKLDQIEKAIARQKYRVIGFTDSANEDNFVKIKNVVLDALDELFPNMSEYERVLKITVPVEQKQDDESDKDNTDITDETQDENAGIAISDTENENPEEMLPMDNPAGEDADSSEDSEMIEEPESADESAESEEEVDEAEETESEEHGDLEEDYEDLEEDEFEDLEEGEYEILEEYEDLSEDEEFEVVEEYEEFETEEEETDEEIEEVETEEEESDEEIEEVETEEEESEAEIEEVETEEEETDEEIEEAETEEVDAEEEEADEEAEEAETEEEESEAEIEEVETEEEETDEETEEVDAEEEETDEDAEEEETDEEIEEAETEEVDAEEKETDEEAEEEETDEEIEEAETEEEETDEEIEEAETEEEETDEETEEAETEEEESDEETETEEAETEEEESEAEIEEAETEEEETEEEEIEEESIDFIETETPQEIDLADENILSLERSLEKLNMPLDDFDLEIPEIDMAIVNEAMEETEKPQKLDVDSLDEIFLGLQKDSMVHEEKKPLDLSELDRILPGEKELMSEVDDSFMENELDLNLIKNAGKTFSASPAPVKPSIPSTAEIHLITEPGQRRPGSVTTDSNRQKPVFVGDEEVTDDDADFEDITDFFSKSSSSKGGSLFSKFGFGGKKKRR